MLFHNVFELDIELELAQIPYFSIIQNRFTIEVIYDPIAPALMSIKVLTNKSFEHLLGCQQVLFDLF